MELLMKENERLKQELEGHAEKALRIQKVKQLILIMSYYWLTCTRTDPMDRYEFVKKRTCCVMLIVVFQEMTYQALYGGHEPMIIALNVCKRIQEAFVSVWASVS